MTQQDPHLWPADFLASIWDEGFDAALDASTDPYITADIEAQRKNPYVIGDRNAA